MGIIPMLFCAALILFIISCLASIMFKWNDLRCTITKSNLPPGTLGWPLFGETHEFLKQGPNFMKTKRARYGSLFKSHILGCPTIVSMDPDLNRYILLNESKGLIPGYPQSMLDILGKSNIAAVHGSTHKYIRASLLSLVGTSMIKDHLFPKIVNFIGLQCRNLHGKTIDIQQKTNEMALFTSFKLIVEDGTDSLYETFKEEFDKLVIGTLSLPINIPGTSYYGGIQGRKNVIKILKRMIEDRRRRCSSKTRDDMLQFLINGEDSSKSNVNVLRDEEILDQMITILYSGYETVSTTSMMAIKYLHDHPKALRQIRDEHLAIQAKKNPGESIDWNDYCSMSFTRAVIFETSRLATVVNGVLRKVTKEMELKGFVIPQGWKIYVYTREVNYDPFLYPEPWCFNPWRWLDRRSLESHKHCFLFGGGSRLCPGKELGIVQIAVFLHHFLTQYRWEEAGFEKIVKFPRVEAPKGLHITISNYQ